VGWLVWNSVVLRAADSAAGRTSDLLVNGTPYDVYTPTTGNIDRIVSQVVSKGSQVRGGGVVIDLSKSPLTPDQLGNILPRVQGVTNQVSNVVVIP
jgi:filamentous hemagglutinin